MVQEQWDRSQTEGGCSTGRSLKATAWQSSRLKMVSFNVGTTTSFGQEPPRTVKQTSCKCVVLELSKPKLENPEHQRPKKINPGGTHAVSRPDMDDSQVGSDVSSTSCDANKDSDPGENMLRRSTRNQRRQSVTSLEGAEG